MFTRTITIASLALTLAAGGAAASQPYTALYPTQTMKLLSAPAVPLADRYQVIKICPPGWSLVTHPLNGQLRCLPNTITWGN